MPYWCWALCKVLLGGFADLCALPRHWAAPSCEKIAPEDEAFELEGQTQSAQCPHCAQALLKRAWLPAYAVRRGMRLQVIF